MPNIERRGNTWYATLHVPKDAQDAVGHSKFFKTLKTTDKRQAEQRAAVLVAGWKAEIQRARGDSDPFIAEAMQWKRGIEQQHNGDAAEGLELHLTDYAEELEAKHGTEKARGFVSIATGQQTPMLHVMPSWKAQLALAPKTIDQMEKDVTRFVSKFQTVEQVTRQHVRSWFQELAGEPENLSPSSIKRIAGFCRNFWGYLQESGAAPTDDQPIITPAFAKASKRGKGSRSNGWVPFTPSDVVTLHGEATRKGDQELADLILLGAYTGARIEELCSLKLDHVTNGAFAITESKTDAGVRQVPIHSKLTPIVERLKVTRKAADDDGYLLAGLTFNKYGDRSNAIGKRFGRLKDSLGFGGKHVFHSIRKTVVTLLENAGVSENLTADIVGHDKPRITYGLYSGGALLEVKREALEKVRYPW
ncbi:MAG: hypothetical protein CMK33_04080 [Porticoccaceae bacterium]|nr:hypothetical protein [Porticoccaceae bacterium]